MLGFFLIFLLQAVVKQHDNTRFLAMLGLFGSVINGVQLYVPLEMNCEFLAV
jgi:hypothetical protein